MNKGFKSLKTADLEHGAVCRAFSYALLCTFVILKMYDEGRVVAVAAAGASQDNCKAFLDKYYERIDLLGEYETLKPELAAEWL